MIFIAKMLGGSHSYGLNTSSSDLDYRGVFLNDDISSLIGLGRHEHQQTQDNGKDEVFTEFRSALKLLRSANTQIVEMLYNENWISIDSRWNNIITHRYRLVDSTKLFSCLRGYMQGELRLANGERTGKLGSKRKEAIETYGFSPKNFVQLLRLAWCGSRYFVEGFFPVNVMEYCPRFGTELLKIKTEPRHFSKESLNEKAKEAEETLRIAFENRVYETCFDEELAHLLCLKIYGPLISQKFKEITGE
jgi:hypothetical protein